MAVQPRSRPRGTEESGGRRIEPRGRADGEDSRLGAGNEAAESLIGRRWRYCRMRKKTNRMGKRQSRWSQMNSDSRRRKTKRLLAVSAFISVYLRPRCLFSDCRLG